MRVSAPKLFTNPSKRRSHCQPTPAINFFRNRVVTLLDSTTEGSETLDAGIKNWHVGSQRVYEPERTWQNIAPLMPSLGITRVANVTGLDRIGIPVVVVCRPNSRSLAVAQGKGPTFEAARVSGVMESIEFHHAERIDAPLRLATSREMQARYKLVNLSKLPQLSISTFNQHQRIHWIEGTDLISAEQCWVPYDMVHMNYTLPFATGSGNFAMNSNGLASGNHPLEAIAHGLCELIERDADALSLLQPDILDQRRVMLDTVDDPLCRELLKRFEDADVVVAAWDITSDIGVPVFKCTIMDRHIEHNRALFANNGSGCHPLRAIALSRALTEAAQSRLTRISSSRDDIRRHEHDISRNPDVLATTLSRLLDQPSVRRFESTAEHATDTFRDDINWLLACLKNSGIDEAICIKLTPPELPYSVVRMVAPGLEGKPGSIGWTPGARAYQAMRRNPSYTGHSH